jgi:hypothetical protein
LTPEREFFDLRPGQEQEIALIAANTTTESFEISPRFRHTILARIARLEQDAEQDEAQGSRLIDGDHIRRHMRLVALERAEALRMSSFLERCRPRAPIAL